MSLKTLIPPTARNGTNPISSVGIALDAEQGPDGKPSRSVTVGLQLNTWDNAGAADVDGTWQILGSCKPQGTPGAEVVDITANFLTPAIVAVAHGTAASVNQFVQGDLALGFIWAIFTPSAGAKKISAYARIV